MATSIRKQMQQLGCVVLLAAVLVASNGVHGFVLVKPREIDTKLKATRSETIHKIALATAMIFVLPQPQPSSAIPPQKSYSTNARNLERLNAGDSSGGSVYDNNPSTPAARRRRAMQGCKIQSARNQAAQILSSKSLSEKDCNMQVMNSSPDFMLQAMQDLECPTCPYGIKQ